MTSRWNDFQQSFLKLLKSYENGGSQKKRSFGVGNTTAVWCRSKRHPDIRAIVDIAPWFVMGTKKMHGIIYLVISIKTYIYIYIDNVHIHVHTYVNSTSHSLLLQTRQMMRCYTWLLIRLAITAWRQLISSLLPQQNCHMIQKIFHL